MNDTVLYRTGAIVFGLSGVVNLIADFLPGREVWNLIGVAAGIGGLAAIWLWQRQAAGITGLVGYGFAMAGLIGIAGFLFADATILPHLPPDTVAALMNGPTGPSIFAAVNTYVLGTLVFVGASLRAGLYPRPALLLWGIGVLPTPFALALPPLTITLGEIVASAGVLWVAAALFRSASSR